MAMKLHWRDAYDREHWRLKQQKPGMMNFTGQKEDWDDHTREIMKKQWEKYRDWENKVKAMEAEFAERSKCTCKRFAWMVNNLGIHAWDCPVIDYPLRQPSRWKNRIEISEAKRAKLIKRLDYENSKRCFHRTGQWYNSSPCCLPDIKLICPVWLDAHCSLYHLPSRISRAQQDLRIANLEKDIAILDIKISELSFHGCDCRCFFGHHPPWCPARGKRGIPMKNQTLK